MNTYSSDNRRQESHHQVTVSDTGDDKVQIKGYTFPLQANHTFRSILSLTHYVLHKGKSMRFHGLDVLFNPVGN